MAALKYRTLILEQFFLPDSIPMIWCQSVALELNFKNIWSAKVPAEPEGRYVSWNNDVLRQAINHTTRTADRDG